MKIKKTRQIYFHPIPYGQAAESCDHMPDRVSAIDHKDLSVTVEYDLLDITFSEVEDRLIDDGYHLDNSLWSKMNRAIIHYCENTELHNLSSHDSRKRAKNQIYAKAWENKPQGDSDPTPPEWRQYR